MCESNQFRKFYTRREFFFQNKHKLKNFPNESKIFTKNDYLEGIVYRV